MIVSAYAYKFPLYSHLKGFNKVEDLGIVQSNPLTQSIDCRLNENVPLNVFQRIGPNAITPIGLEQFVAIAECRAIVTDNLIARYGIPSWRNIVGALTLE